MPKETINQNNLLFYQRVSLEGIKTIERECFKQYDKDNNIKWLELAKEANQTILMMSEELMRNYYNGRYRPKDEENEYGR